MITTLEQLCGLFDKYEIVDTQMKIDREYYSSSDVIHTDGDIKTSVNYDGYITIESVVNATYLMFMDLEQKIYLCVYKYVPKTQYKHIKQELQILKNKIGVDDNIVSDININDDVVDINTFRCVECDFNDKLIFKRSKSNPEALECKCKMCKTEYTFVPSKYYKLSSKRVIYFKSEESSRQIVITANNAIC